MLVAVAGGIGSGKSVFCRFLREMGAECLSADEINAELLRDEGYLIGLQARFPVAFSNGKLDKGALRDLIYENENARKALNAYAHPRLMAEMERRARARKGVTFIEIPLLMEGEFYRRFDAVVAVIAPQEERVKRIMARNGVGEERARAMIRTQAKEEGVREVADVVVINDGTEERLQEEARRVCLAFGG